MDTASWKSRVAVPTAVVLVCAACLFLAASRWQISTNQIVWKFQNHITTFGNPSAVATRNSSNATVGGFSQEACEKLSPSLFHGQGREDYGLWKKFFSDPQVCNGTFIELGAVDGVLFSNTLMFERDLGWRGALVEGAPQQIPTLRANRPLAAVYHGAVCDAGGGTRSVAFRARAASAIGGVEERMPRAYRDGFRVSSFDTYQVPCVSLRAVAREAGLARVDLLSLDVEGMELPALRGFDWAVPVHVILVEMNRDVAAIRAYLSARGFASTRPRWSVRGYCRGGAGCPSNEVFVNTAWPHAAPGPHAGEDSGGRGVKGSR